MYAQFILHRIYYVRCHYRLIRQDYFKFCSTNSNF